MDHNPASLQHPAVHREWSPWSEDQTLHVACMYSNQFRWRTRRELAQDCIRHLRQTPNVVVHTGELAFGDRPFELTGFGDPNDLQLRTSTEYWAKENVLKLIIQRFPPNWKYGAWIDMDFHLTRHDWALETIHQLQHYDWVQPFSSYADLSGKDYGRGMRPVRINSGFAYNYVQNGYQLPDGYGNGGWKVGHPVLDEYGVSMALEGEGKLRPVGATGGAWAFRRSAYDAVGGMLDICILGHGDWFMCFGLVSREAPDVGFPNYTDGYRRLITEWQRNAARLKQNIGYTDQFAVHHFHGSKFRRFYSSRYHVLIDNQFDPLTDLRPDYQGVYQLSGEKPALRDAIRRYFIERSEDDPHLSEDAGERSLV